jgi:hypothetical protein
MPVEIIGETADVKTNEMERRFVICIANEGCEDLEVRKVYQVLADEAADEDNYLRVIDESEEDYLYPAEYFIEIKLPAAAKEAFLTVADQPLHSQA